MKQRGTAPPAVLLVMLGGVVGALARVGIGAALPHEPGTWSWSTLLGNTVGATVLCALLPLLRTPSVRLAVATGLLGSFTTFSGFAVDAVLLAEAGRVAVAVGYVLVSVAALLLGGLLGLAVAGRVRQ